MVSDTVTIKPDMRVVHPEYGDITEDVARELAAIRRADHEQLVRDADRWQAQIIAARPGEAVVQKGFALKAEIHPAIVSHWRMRYGAGFWKHELDWFLKKNPKCRVKNRSAKPTIVVPALSLSNGPAVTARVGPVGRRGRWAL